MTVAYENGVNLFDTAEVYASGRSDATFTTNHQRNPEWGFNRKPQMRLRSSDSACLPESPERLDNIVQPCLFLHRAEITLGNIIKKKGWR